MTEISSDGKDSEATLLDEAQAEITRSLVDEFAAQTSEETVAEIVEKTIGALGLKGFIDSGALRIGSHYKFANLRPHPESPITDDAFSRLDEAVAEVNTRLGIDNLDRYFAHSSSRKGDPVLTVDRREGPDGLSIIGATVHAEDGMWNLHLRNDGGTVRDPKQAAGTRMNYDRRGNPVEEVWASNQDVVELTELVTQRLEQDRFVKKEKQFRLHL